MAPVSGLWHPEGVSRRRLVIVGGGRISLWAFARAYKCNRARLQPGALFVFNDRMTYESDAALAAKIAAQLAAAKEQLLEQMIQMGCTPAKGWRIGEELRHTLAGTEFVFRPLHLREASPELHVKVVVDHNGRPASPPQA